MRRSIIIMILLAVFVLPLSINTGVKHCYAAQGTISLDFKAVDIHVLIKFISEITGKNFIVDKAVGGRVTIYSSSKISIKEAYKVFESVLQLNGYVIVPSGSAYKILPSGKGRNLALPTRIGEKIRNYGDELVTQIIPLKKSSVVELGNIVKSMLGSNGAVNIYKPSNTLIVTALASNIQNVLKIVNEVDKRQYATRSANIVIKYGDSKTIASSVNKIMAAKIADMQKMGRSGLALTVADERTNSIYILADSANLVTIKSMVKSMDVPTPAGKGGIHLYSLKNASAEDLAKVLTSLVSGASTAKDKKDQVVSGKVKIVADKSTNSLVITARPDDYTHLEKIIKKMDIRRKQVFIEALIMEVSESANFEFGVNWAIPASGGDVTAFASANPGGSSSGVVLDDKTAMAAFPAGGAIGALFSDIIKVNGKSYSVQAMVSASASDDNFKVLSTPQLLTLDNQEAKVDVVENIPYTKENTTGTNRDYDSQSIAYKDVGVKLKVTPQIGVGNTLRLKVNQEVSRVSSSSVKSGDRTILAPTTRKREVDTMIQVKDGQTIVIAGLLGEDDVINESKVPLLGDIPGLGYLFRYEKKEKKKTNLYVFLTPKIMDTVKEENELYKEKRQLMYDIEVGEDGLGEVRIGDPVLPDVIF